MKKKTYGVSTWPKAAEELLLVVLVSTSIAVPTGVYP